jgi:hypothetical protein
MKLTDLARVIYEDAFVWISEDPDSNEGIYFGQIGDMVYKTMKLYEVVEIWPEHYRAIARAGISIHVRKINQQEA